MGKPLTIIFAVDTVIDENASSPKCSSWVKDLNLTKSDLHALKSNGELTENIINASQKLLSLQHCQLKGFQETHLGTLLQFSTITEPGVQILHTGMLITQGLRMIFWVMYYDSF